MKKSPAISCLFLDIGRVLLSNGWDRHAVLDAHAAVQKVTEALAAKRTAESTHTHS